MIVTSSHTELALMWMADVGVHVNYCGSISFY